MLKNYTKDRWHRTAQKEVTTMADGDNPFILLARITVKEGMVDDYLKIASAADKSVQSTEEGMLFHNFDSDPDDPNKFVWTEIYRKSQDFLFHADNPPVQEYIEKHSELAGIFQLRFMEMCPAL